MRAVCGTQPAWIVLGLLALFPTHPRMQSSVGPLTVTAPGVDELDAAAGLLAEMSQHGRLRVTQVALDPLVPSSAHRRLEQIHQGVRILGADLAEQTASGRTVSVFGRLHLDVSLDVAPVLSAHDATQQVNQPDPRSIRAPELVIVFDETSDRYRLAYRVTSFGVEGRVATLVDAETGAIISRELTLPTQLGTLCGECAVGRGRGVKGDLKKVSVRAVADVYDATDLLRPSRISTYDMRGDWNRVLDVLTGVSTLSDSDLAKDADNDWTDSAGVDAHTGAGWTTDYLYHRFGRRGLDGNDTPIAVMTHPIRRDDIFSVPSAVANLFHLNAFFCGTCIPGGVIVLGEGLPPGLTVAGTGQQIDFFAAGLDVLGHELGHAVTESSSRLIYQDESGALSEAFSDLIGVGLEFFVAESGRHQSEQPDYLVGEDVVVPGGIRSLDNPRSMGDPDHYSLRFQGTADNGGVHTNSAIVTHAFYLAIEGGTNVTSGMVVSGLGREQRALIEQVFYRAFAFLLPADSTFAMARAATLQSARDLSNDAAVERAIAAAWTAVGVE